LVSIHLISQAQSWPLDSAVRYLFGCINGVLHGLMTVKDRKVDSNWRVFVWSKWILPR
jgi:hypothetical protein